MSVLALRIALSHLKQKMFARVVVVLCSAFVLAACGLMGVLVQSFSGSLQKLNASRVLTAYLEPEISNTKEIEVLSAIKKVKGVSEAQLVNKNAFLANFSKLFPQLSKDMQTLDEDVVPRYVKVNVQKNNSQEVQTRLEKILGVEFVENNKGKYQGLVSVLAQLRKVLIFLLAGMTAALLCIMANHFKLASAYQSQVRQTYALLGARKWQMLQPFLIEGGIEGGAAGLCALVGLFLCGTIFESRMNEAFSTLGYQTVSLHLLPVAALLLFVGIFSGVIGSLWAARKLKA